MRARLHRWMATGTLALSVLAPAFAQGGAPAGSSPAPRVQKHQISASVRTEPRVVLTAGEVRFNGRFQGWPQAQTAAGNNGVPSVSPNYPNAPFQHPDIQRNYLQMRATSPRPNQFMGGAYNPVYPATPDRAYTPYVWYHEGYGRPLDYGYGTVFSSGYGYVIQPGYSVYQPW